MIYCAYASRLGDSNNSWRGLLFLPTVLCPLTTADYLYITTTLPLSHPSLLLSATSHFKPVVAPENHPTSEKIHNVYVHFQCQQPHTQIHFWPVYAQQRKLPRFKQTVLFFSLSFCSEMLQCSYGYQGSLQGIWVQHLSQRKWKKITLAKWKFIIHATSAL